MISARTDLPSLSGSRAQAAALRILAFAWQVVVPALLAGVVLRYLVPRTGHGIEGRVADLGREHALYFYVALFLFFSGLLHYWRLRMPGGRYIAGLPVLVSAPSDPAASMAETAAQAALYERLRSASVRERLERALGGPKRRQLDDALDSLRTALLRGDASAAAAARSRAEAILALVSTRQWVLRMLAGCAVVGAFVLAASILRWKVAAPYEVTSSSMLPTLKPGETFVGNRLAFAGGETPRRGDVIAFRSADVGLGPGLLTVPDVLVKRVIGLPGDRIDVRGGLPVINGWQVPSCGISSYAYMLDDGPRSDTLRAMRGELRLEFLGDRAYLTVNASSPSFEGYSVKPGEVFVLGDNRGNSLDSRAYNGGRGGGVPMAGIEARAERFLARRLRNGAIDLERLLHPLGELDADLRHEDALDWGAARDAMRKCLQNRPRNTEPPAPPASTPAAAPGGA